MPKIKETKSNINEAYRAIKRLMLKQKLIPGQKLLYRELSEWLNMSKTPIVNALNRLEQEGFVTSEPNVGYMIKPIDQKEIFDSCEVREALEIKALETAIKSATVKQMAGLEERCRSFDQYRPYRYDKKKLMLDCEFHLQIAVISNNEVLRYLLRRNFDHMILRTQQDNYIPERMEISSRDHRSLLDLMGNQDFPKSAALLSRHIRNDRDHVLLCISGEDQDEMDVVSLFESGFESGS